MPSTLRFHGELRDLLRRVPRAAPAGSIAPLDGAGSDAFASRQAADGRSIKDAIEAAGIPHTEIDLILVAGTPVGLSYRVAPADVVDVFGLDRPAELRGLPGLASEPPQPPRFVLDGHLGRLARYLRLLGFDAAYAPDAADDDLARASVSERRVLLSRDRGLLKRSIVTFGYLVRADDPRAQLVEVVDRFGLRPLVRSFSRCLRCNGMISPVPKASVIDELRNEPRTLRYFESFARCQSCGAIYWEGSHVDRMRRDVLEAVSADATDHAAVAERRNEV